jgi:signal transduction histidine kinase
MTTPGSCPPGGRPPVPPDVGLERPDGKNRHFIGPFQPDERPLGESPVPPEGAVTKRERLRAHWPALLLPLVAADTLGLFMSPVPILLIIVALTMAFLATEKSARLTPFAFLAYGGYGLILFHKLSTWGSQPIVYGLVPAGTDDKAGYVLPQAIAFLAAGIWLLARTGAPGGDAVRRAVAQLRGTGGQPKTVPPLLLLPVIFLWEELFSEHLWFGLGRDNVGRLTALVLVIAGAALIARLPRLAAALAVAGLLIFGLYGVLDGVRHLVSGSSAWQSAGPGGLNFEKWAYGAVPLNVSARTGGLLAAIQGLALLGAGCALAPRLLTWGGDIEMAKRALALTQRVTRLTQTRSDATEVAVAELRRIERDLHDGAQARLVAVGMSLRAAEELMRANPEAALALVAEARETSSRALDDLRGLVRGIYPPVLADRGLADAVRALALDAPVTVETDITLPGEPPMPVAAAVYFGLAEALTNAVRHSGADLVQIGIGYSDGMLRATVIDDGTGGADPSHGTGLSGVERRLATFDGILAVTSPPGGPTIVVIEVPCTLRHNAGWSEDGTGQTLCDPHDRQGHSFDQRSLN